MFFFAEVFEVNTKADFQNRLNCYKTHGDLNCVKCMNFGGCCAEAGIVCLANKKHDMERVMKRQLCRAAMPLPIDSIQGLLVAIAQYERTKPIPTIYETAALAA